MRLSLILSIAVLLAIFGGIAYIASTDVSIKQKTVTVTIPNERFYNDSE